MERLPHLYHANKFRNNTNYNASQVLEKIINLLFLCYKHDVHHNITHRVALPFTKKTPRANIASTLL